MCCCCRRPRSPPAPAAWRGASPAPGPAGTGHHTGAAPALPRRLGPPVHREEGRRGRGRGWCPRRRPRGHLAGAAALPASAPLQRPWPELHREEGKREEEGGAPPHHPRRGQCASPAPGRPPAPPAVDLLCRRRSATCNHQRERGSRGDMGRERERHEERERER